MALQETKLQMIDGYMANQVCGCGVLVFWFWASIGANEVFCVLG